jgi:hypothetical protein
MKSGIFPHDPVNECNRDIATTTGDLTFRRPSEAWRKRDVQYRAKGDETDLCESWEPAC